MYKFVGYIAEARNGPPPDDEDGNLNEVQAVADALTGNL